MWDDLRLAELDELNELFNVATAINKGSGAIERIQRVIELASKLSHSDRASGRRSFSQFLVEQAHTNNNSGSIVDGN